MSFPLFVFSATSENYHINSDVIGVGGGTADSESYKVTDTLGQTVVGKDSGQNYNLQEGYWNSVNSSLAFAVDSNGLDLGSMIPGNPISGQTELSVSTDSWSGYDLYVNQNHPLTHADTVTTIPDYVCSISSPCLWSGTGLGFSVVSGTNVDPKWGTTSNYKYALLPTDATVFHGTTGFSGSVDQTVVGLRLDVPSGQKNGDYANIVTYTAMVRL